MRALLISGALAVLMGAPAFARDVYVQSYTRSDGTYVQLHVRSAPDASRANNYGPSMSGTGSGGGTFGYGLMSPTTIRDHDRDGTPNYVDHDDDNDITPDDRDRTQYGRVEPYAHPSPYRKK